MFICSTASARVMLQKDSRVHDCIWNRTAAFAKCTEITNQILPARKQDTDYANAEFCTPRRKTEKT